MQAGLTFTKGVPTAFGRPTHQGNSGAVLLEVVLALVLFVAAATIITSGLSASVNEVSRLRLDVHARNLAASVLAQMQMGLQTVESSGPNAFDPPFDAWTWQAIAGPVPDAVGGVNTLQKVEVVVRHKAQAEVFRLIQFLPPALQSSTPSDSASQKSPADSTDASGDTAPF